MPPARRAPGRAATRCGRYLTTRTKNGRSTFAGEHSTGRSMEAMGMPNSSNGKRRRVAKPKSDHVQIRSVPLDEITPSPENDLLYKPVREDDPEVQKLAESIQQNGLKEPLVLTLDYYVLSGHRRRVAAMIAGLTEVPCRFEPIR